MEPSGLVLDIDRFSTHDGPGIRTAIFLQGCPLGCRWCHSPESQPMEPVLLYQAVRCTGCGTCLSRCPAGALERRVNGVAIRRDICIGCFACAAACPTRALYPSSRITSLGEVERILRQDRPFYQSSGGGVTVSGGEPLAQAGFTLAVLRLCRSLGIHCAVETSGYGAPEDLEAIASLADLLYYDIKLLDPGRHLRATGVDNRLILENLSRLCALEEVVEKIVARIPCIPEINDSQGDILEMITYAKGLGIRRMEPLPYNPMAQAKYDWVGMEYPLAGVVPRAGEHLCALRGLVLENGMRLG